VATEVGERGITVGKKFVLMLVLCVASVEAFMASLDRAHVAYRDMKGVGKMQTRVDGVKQTYVKDPDGYWIEVNDAKY
jgi:lactoylglutathione lyase